MKITDIINPWAAARRAERQLINERAEVGRQISRKLLAMRDLAKTVAQRDAAQAKLDRIIALETPGMAPVGKRAVAIAKGER